MLQQGSAVSPLFFFVMRAVCSKWAVSTAGLDEGGEVALYVSGIGGTGAGFSVIP